MPSTRLVHHLGGGAIAAVLLSGSAAAQLTTRVSVDSSGAEVDHGGTGPAISADGRFVAFVSDASSLVPGDMNGMSDVFVRDRYSDVTERVSVDSSGAEANGGSALRPAISADGRFVAFASDASNLVPRDTNGMSDVFVHDRTSGLTERVSVDSSGGEGNDESSHDETPAMSADGQLVVFTSVASNLVPNDTNGMMDVFVHDRSTGRTERVNVDSSGAETSGSCMDPAISADGRIAGFAGTAVNLVPGKTDAQFDIFVHDRTTGVTERVSVDSTGAEANKDSYHPSLSADGQIVAFKSNANNLVASTTRRGIFVHDRISGVTEIVSVDSNGNPGFGASDAPSISADGQVVAFESIAGDLVFRDWNDVKDVFVHDRSTGNTERVSVSSSGAEGSGDSSEAALSADGGFVAFSSWSSDLVPNDTNRDPDVFVRIYNGCPASWSNYGAGFPGTNGVPSFVSQADPVLGTTLTLALNNSYWKSTIGLLFLGFQRTSVHSGWGGDLLVVPALTLPVSLFPGVTSFIGAIPLDDALCGFTIDLQAIESDPGAAEGISFTQGLELVLGY